MNPIPRFTFLAKKIVFYKFESVDLKYKNNFLKMRSKTHQSRVFLVPCLRFLYFCTKTCSLTYARVVISQIAIVFEIATKNNHTKHL